MFRRVVELVIIFAIFGCGMMANPKESLSVPQNISIEMPKALIEDSNTTAQKSRKMQKEDEDDGKSIGYIELKEDVAHIEGERGELELILLFINQVVEEIDTRCKEVKLEEICRIEEDSLEFLFDENLSQKVIELTGNALDEHEVGDTLSFGEIEFVQYADNKTYQYVLNLDATDSISVANETISWSRDERHIFSVYVEETSEMKNRIEIDYEKEESGNERIGVENSYLQKDGNFSDTFILNMLKKANTDETYELTSNSYGVDEDLGDFFIYTVGELSNSGGYLDFDGEFDGEVFREIDRFDGDGEVISSRYCYEDEGCDMEDEATWVIDED